MFISFEGGDGCGKSTQISLLKEWFISTHLCLPEEVLIFREPGSTPLGESVREILLHRSDLNICRESELFLFMTARAQLSREIIRPALERGCVVLTDRFLLSSVVYQGYAGGLDIKKIWEIGLFATDGLLPDYTFILDIPSQESHARITREADRMELQGTVFHDKVRNGFLTEAALFPDKFCILDATESVSSIHEKICQRIKKRFYA